MSRSGVGKSQHRQHICPMSRRPWKNQRRCQRRRNGAASHMPPATLLPKHTQVMLPLCRKRDSNGNIATPCQSAGRTAYSLSCFPFTIWLACRGVQLLICCSVRSPLGSPPRPPPPHGDGLCCAEMEIVAAMLSAQFGPAQVDLEQRSVQLQVLQPACDQPLLRTGHGPASRLPMSHPLSKHVLTAASELCSLTRN